ncbi:hypothetical protein DM558_00380 [Entomomonas moraniae]|uniref:Uncharacterized protein n=1 Tax=Entomomonas moraniae TaxID=2213226 RepID=A0A3S9XAC9_9GAMM|nr:hypothetical protein DM558_00380 [Entomomonas moraniae]
MLNKLLDWIERRRTTILLIVIITGILIIHTDLCDIYRATGSDYNYTGELNEIKSAINNLESVIRYK